MKKTFKGAVVCAAFMATALVAGCSEQKKEETPAAPSSAATEAPKPAEPAPAPAPAPAASEAPKPAEGAPAETAPAPAEQK